MHTIMRPLMNLRHRVLVFLRHAPRQRSPERGPGREGTPALALESYGSFAEFEAAEVARSPVWHEQRVTEAALIPTAESAWVEGYCHVCAGPRRFLVDFQYGSTTNGHRMPNWRERLQCSGCDLNNRMRACIQIFETVLKPAHDATIYITEQTTPVYAHLRQRYPNLIGSEYLDPQATRKPAAWAGLRHEDFTALSFPDRHLDFLLTFDVLEHVPDFQRALAEGFRCLRPGGQLLLTAPFRADAPYTLVRASLRDDGSVEHREAPEYHGNPLDPEGCLCFYHFGWDLLDRLRDEGFTEVRVLRYWSRELGYLGTHQLAIVARKPD
jgi:SAM-dependent methyltransferase